MKTILILTILLFNQTIFACDKSKYTMNKSYEKADYIFSGAISNLRYLDEIEQTKLEPRIIVTFKVNEIWKGKRKKEIILHTTHNKGSCNGFVFKTGIKYLVYAVAQKRTNNFLAKLFSKKEPTIGVKMYGGTMPLSDAAQEIIYLNKKQKI